MLYRIYNTTIQSDIIFPQLVPEKERDTWTYEIKNKELPKEIQEDIAKKGGPAGKGDGFYWINTPCGHFAIVGNNAIIANCKTEDEVRVISTYILGYGLSMLFYLNNQMAVHCSAIEKNGNGYLIAGFSGAGKSTLAGRFLDNGFKLLSDDVAIIQTEGEDVVTYPAYPQRKLCRDAAVNTGLVLEELTYIDEDKDKFAVSCEDSFANNKGILRGMIVLCPYDGEEVVLEEMKGQDKIQLFVNNLFLQILFARDGVGMEPQKFFTCLQLIGKFPIYKAFRPKKAGDTTEELMRQILYKMPIV